MRLIDADAFKKYIIKGFEEMKSQFKTEFYLDIAARVTESFLEDIDEQPTVEAQPTEECEENGSPWCLGHCPYRNTSQCPYEAQPTSDDEIIKALKAVRTIHNGNYAPQIDEAIRRLEAQPTDAVREAYIKGYDYGVKDWFKSKTQPSEDVLDEIRAEIIQVANQEKVYDEKWTLGLRYAVNIIDKYRKRDAK